RFLPDRDRGQLTAVVGDRPEAVLDPDRALAVARARAGHTPAQPVVEEVDAHLPVAGAGAVLAGAVAHREVVLRHRGGGGDDALADPDGGVVEGALDLEPAGPVDVEAVQAGLHHRRPGAVGAELDLLTGGRPPGVRRAE